MIIVNKKALSIILVVSSMYGDYEFLFSGFNDFAEGLPEIATIFSVGISQQTLDAIEAMYRSELATLFPKGFPELYDDIDFIRLEDLDTAWYSYKSHYLKIKNGKIKGISDRAIHEIMNTDANLRLVSGLEFDLRNRSF